MDGKGMQPAAAPGCTDLVLGVSGVEPGGTGSTSRPSREARWSSRVHMSGDRRPIDSEKWKHNTHEVDKENGGLPWFSEGLRIAALSKLMSAAPEDEISQEVY